jgi:hypothetical protein
MFVFIDLFYPILTARIDETGLPQTPMTQTPFPIR